MIARFENLRLDLGFILVELGIDGALQGDDARILGLDDEYLVVRSPQRASDLQEIFLIVLHRLALLFPPARNPGNSTNARGARRARRITTRRILRPQGDFRRENECEGTENQAIAHSRLPRA